jgi:hypothetical protein
MRLHPSASASRPSSTSALDRHVANWPAPDGRDRRKPSAAHWFSGPAGATRHRAATLPLERQRNSCPYRPASRGSHIRGALWQIRQNRFHRDGFRCGGTRARAERVRGGLNVAACSSLAQGSRSLSPIRSGSLLTHRTPKLALPPAGTCRSIFAGGLWTRRVCWSCRTYRVRAGQGTAQHSNNLLPAMRPVRIFGGIEI